MALLKYENMKLKQQLIFSIPVSKEICGRECAGCYALKPQKRFPAVLKSRTDTYELTQRDDFLQIMNDELMGWHTKLARKGITPRIVRIHEAGEFYSKAYIKKWRKIAICNPQWTFYSFTKRLKDFPKAFKKFMALPNVHITDSLLENRLNYGKLEDSKLMFVCPATVDGSECHPDKCKWCYQKDGAPKNGVYFKQH